MSRTRWAVVATVCGGLSIGLSGCASAPAPAAMAMAILAAEPSGEALAQGDWTKLGEPGEAQRRRMAEQGVSHGAYRAGLVRLQRDAAYREQVAQAMLKAAVRPPGG